jgi:4'-phosphopantetheinyl transferase
VLRDRIQQQFFLRLLLAAYLGCPGKSIELERSERGKPRLAGEHAGCGLDFNVSHSGPWLAVAIGSGAAVGIDIERERRLERAPLLARRFLSAREADRIEQLDEPFRSKEFLEQWTARESLVKARGCGLAGCLGEIELDSRPPSVRQLPSDWQDADRMSLCALALPDALVGHFASLSPGVKPVVRQLVV